MPTTTGNKQFVVFFLLVTVLLTAISIATALIMKEAEVEFDVSGVQNDLEIIIDQAANKIQDQKGAVHQFIISVDQGLDDIINANDANMVLAFNVIKSH